MLSTGTVHILGCLSVTFSSFKMHNTPLRHSHNKRHLLSLRPGLLIQPIVRRFECGITSFKISFPISPCFSASEADPLTFNLKFITYVLFMA